MNDKDARARSAAQRVANRAREHGLSRNDALTAHDPKTIRGCTSRRRRWGSEGRRGRGGALFAARTRGGPRRQIAAALAAERDAGLVRSGVAPAQVEAWRAAVRVRVPTPGSTADEAVHLLSELERRSSLWETDLESARTALSSSLSLVLRLVGRHPDHPTARVPTLPSRCSLAFASTTGNAYLPEDGGESWVTLGQNLPPVYAVRFA